MDGDGVTAVQEKPTLDAGMTAEQAAPLVLTAAANEFAVFLGDLLASDDPDGPHKSRVALRRLLSALLAFKPIIAADLAARIKDYFKVIGQLRDADVLANDISGAGEPKTLQVDADRVRRKVRKQLLHKQAGRVARQVEKRFGGTDWRRRTRAAKALRHGPVSALAAPALDRSWTKCLSHGADLASMAVAERHELRKALKNFRYLCEYFASLWPDDQAEPFLATLRSLQDDLGKLNDLAMAREHGLVVGDANEGTALQCADAAWTRLAVSAKWWA